MVKRYPRILFRKKLKDLKKDMEKMGKLTLKAQKDAIDSFDSYDEKLEKNVIEYGKRIDRMAVDLERTCLSIIAAEQPVAGDLRFIEACIKIISHLKRIKGLSVNIAEISRNLKDVKLPEKTLEYIKHMADIVLMMSSKSLYSFLDQNLKAAGELWVDDDKVDELFDRALSNIIDNIVEDREKVYYLINLLFLIRFLERIADRDVSIGRRTIFMVTCEREPLYEDLTKGE
ncbi:MAG: phosphate signaling complex protein PhoU [Euryarchaeota archaeon]|nr:phosphate signaling complex protein PhoU [Euryarchaeota archaeon]